MLTEAVSLEFKYEWIFQYLCVGAGCFQLRMRKRIGCHSNMNVSPTFATRVDA